MEIHGICDVRFQDVRYEFVRNFTARGEVGASVCAIVEGRTVVEARRLCAHPFSFRAAYYCCFRRGAERNLLPVGQAASLSELVGDRLAACPTGAGFP